MFTGVINPFGYQTAAGMAALNSTQIIGEVREATAKDWVVDGVASKEVWNLPAGPMSLALGFQYQDQEYTDIPAAILGSADIIGGGGEQFPVQGDRDRVVAVRRTLDPDHQEPRCAGGGALGRLQRFRQRCVTEGRPALAADERGAAAWFVRSGLPRSDDSGSGAAAGAHELGWCL